MNVIAKYRDRNGLTQQQVANQLHVDKSYISRVESGQKPMTPTMYESGFESITDAHTLNDMAYESTRGYTVPTPSNTVYDDHRMSIKYRLKREISEAMEALQHHCLDKNQEYLTHNEKESLFLLISEVQDVIFEAQGFVNKLVADYTFIEPKDVKQRRDARLKMERRI